MRPDETPKTMAQINAHLRDAVHPTVTLTKGVCCFWFTFGEYGLGPTDYEAMLLNDRTAAQWTAYVREALTSTLAGSAANSIEAFDARCRANGRTDRVRWA